MDDMDRMDEERRLWDGFAQKDGLEPIGLVLGLKKE